MRLDTGFLRRVGLAVLMFFGAWLGVRYLLPILLPFVLGWMFAALAEPAVGFLSARLRLPRPLSSVLAVGAGFVMIFALAWILGAAVYRELTVLAGGLPAFLEGAADTTVRLRDWALTMASKAPEGLSAGVSRWVTQLFADGTVLLEKAADGALGMAGNVMGGLPGGALLVGTTVISSFMISAQLPGLRQKVKGLACRPWAKKWTRALLRIKGAVGGWLKAQAKLSGVTLVIVGGGLMLLGVANPLFWAVVVALVDAVPMLGSGTVLIPWCLIALLRGERVLALGLLGVYVAAMVTRSALEPKLVGRQLGMNPLMTLIALYAGYRIWGVAGMIFAPILAVTAKQLATMKE